MTKLPPSLAALDAHLRQQNDDARRRVFGERPRVRGRRGGRPAPTAPMPMDPAVCRWCAGKLRSLKPGEPPTYCQSGCAANDIEPYLRQCADCRRDFRTGHRTTDLCIECAGAAVAAIAAVEEVEQVPQATRDDFGERRRRA